jgi:hypothetical protein
MASEVVGGGGVGKLLSTLGLLSLPEPILIRRIASKFALKYRGGVEIPNLLRELGYRGKALLRVLDEIRVESDRQEKLTTGRHARRYSNERTAALVQMDRPNRVGRFRKLIRESFADYIKSHFDSDTLVLLQLTKGAGWSWNIEWQGGEVRPAISCVIRVVAERRNGSFTAESFAQNMLLYKTPGTSEIKSAFTNGNNVKDAFADQFPLQVFELVDQGYKFLCDYREQLIVLTKNGKTLVFDWTGKPKE